MRRSGSVAAAVVTKHILQQSCTSTSTKSGTILTTPRTPLSKMTSSKASSPHRHQSMKFIHSSSKAKQGVTYAQQSKIPHLPIPSIASTAAKFLETARPFVSDVTPGAPVAGEEHQTEEYKRVKAAVEDFKTSPFVQELQSRLEKHAEGKDSWLIDWFNSANYFGAQCPQDMFCCRADGTSAGYRDPIIPWVNYYYVHKVCKALVDSGSHTESAPQDDRSRRTGPARAASLVRAMLYFRRMLNK